MDKRYLTAFLNPPKYIVGGIELDFFCPRHFITLQAVESPFLDASKAGGISYKDLFIALRICSTSSWIEGVKRPPFFERLKYYMLEGIMSKQISAYSEFGHYLSESMTFPKVWVKQNESNSERKPTNIPETITMVTLLMTKFGFSEKEAWNMPFSKAVWYATAYGAQEGAEISVITTESEEKEDEDIATLKEHQEKIDDILKTKGVKVK